MSVTKLAQASRLMLQASNLLADASALGEEGRGASMALLSPTLSKLNEAFSSIAVKDIPAARKHLTAAKKLLVELRAKMPRQPNTIQ